MRLTGAYSLDVRLNVSTRSGKVRVIAETGQELTIEGGTITGENDGVLDIRRVRGSNTITVLCPADSDVTVGTVSGTVEFEGSLGAVRVVTVSGKVRVQKAAQVDVRAKSGSVEVEECTGDCRIVVTSAKIRVGRAQRASIAGVSGLVAAEGVGAAEVKTVSGRVLLGTTGPGSVSVRTVSGKVEIRVPPDVRPQTRLKSISGHIKNECPRGEDGEIAVASVSGAIRVSCS
jgi:DUF4097 and DUF4098 domain-containing protein YvlB